MKHKKLIEVRNKDQKSLEKDIEEIKISIKKTDMEVRAGKEKNLKKSKNLKKDLSQLLTIKRELEIIKSENNVKIKGDSK